MTVQWNLICCRSQLIKILAELTANIGGLEDATACAKVNNLLNHFSKALIFQSLYLCNLIVKTLINKSSHCNVRLITECIWETDYRMCLRDWLQNMFERLITECVWETDWLYYRMCLRDLLTILQNVFERLIDYITECVWETYWQY